MSRRATLIAGVLAVAILIAGSVWIATVTHTVRVSGCYTEFGLLHGGGLPECNHAEAQVATYPHGQGYLICAALGVALLTAGLLWRDRRSQPAPAQAPATPRQAPAPRSPSRRSR